MKSKLLPSFLNTKFVIFMLLKKNQVPLDGMVKNWIISMNQNESLDNEHRTRRGVRRIIIIDFYRKFF